uniref:Uncharacterized protein n=1 Tax=Arundo donax TaxID=35708 RepID=A0A0A9ACA0_ARUDO
MHTRQYSRKNYVTGRQPGLGLLPTSTMRRRRARPSRQRRRV